MIDRIVLACVGVVGITMIMRRHPKLPPTLTSTACKLDTVEGLLMCTHLRVGFDNAIHLGSFERRRVDAVDFGGRCAHGCFPWRVHGGKLSVKETLIRCLTFRQMQ